MEQPRDEEPWVPPVWPRYVGIGWLVFCVVGFALLGVLALREVSGPDGTNVEAVMGILIAAGGIYYVVPQLRNAWAKLRETRES